MPLTNLWNFYSFYPIGHKGSGKRSDMKRQKTRPCGCAFRVCVGRRLPTSSKPLRLRNRCTRTTSWECSQCRRWSAVRDKALGRWRGFVAFRCDGSQLELTERDVVVAQVILDYRAQVVYLHAPSVWEIQCRENGVVSIIETHLDFVVITRGNHDVGNLRGKHQALQFSF